MDKRLKKAQVAMEYMLLISFLFMMTTVVMYYLSMELGTIEKENKNILADNIMKIVDNNLQIALAANDGYRSTFNLPGQVNGMNISYGISNFTHFSIYYYPDSPGYILANSTVGSLCFNESRRIYTIKVEREQGLVSLSSCLNCTVTFRECYIANKTNTCGLLPAAVRNQCHRYHCIC